MKDIIEFVPQGAPAPVQRFWLLLILLNILISGAFILTRSGHTHIYVVPVILFILTFGTGLFTKRPVKVSFFLSSGKMQYDYLNAFNKQRQITVDIKTAYYSYKAYTTRGGSRMRLLIYNNYFTNKIDLRVAAKNGFTRNQLDAMTRLIKETSAG